MTSPTCVKCGSGSFEMKPASPTGSNFNLCFIQCSNCGGVVGVLETVNVNSVLAKQNKAISAIAQQLGVHVDLR